MLGGSRDGVGVVVQFDVHAVGSADLDCFLDGVRGSTVERLNDVCFGE